MAKEISVADGYATLVRPDSRTNIISASFTRPSDTNAYADGDAVNNSTSAPVAMSFKGVGRAEGYGAVLFAALLKKSTATTTNASFRLFLFCGSSAPTPANDNAAYSMGATDGANLLGWVDFSSSGWYAGTNFAVCQGTVNGDRIALAALTGGTCYGLLQAKAAYTPGSAEQFTVELFILQD